ncbi:MAG TPA: acetylornithine/succinylornithine family transaminase [Ktedonosporobacter sp.]|jgi:predicted acetylornithine/succinylornithine family transaminase/N-acetyl-ornithine/N-acetyl-lysine deacetylase|nr:acetylornithine/succinylornithine family transaminase [Ktedonosporobacter sp.]
MSNIIDLENTYTSGVYSKRPVAIVRGEGATLWDDDGRAYIDCAAGHGVANIGHGRSEIAAALSAQALRLVTCPEIVYNDTRAHLLERLVRLTPEGLDRVFLCNSGTEAIEGALKLARLVTGRTGIVATLRGFHGRSMGALSATWEPHYREPFAPLVPGVTHIRYNNLAAAEDVITAETAAVLVELIQGEGGVHIATDDYIHGLARLCRERGALLIVDEVQTGFGRTGRLFACTHYDLSPDILCLAKSLAGGVPMGAICLGPRVTESGRISKGAHGSTFGGNPLACAAALATLDIIEREALPQRSAELGAYALERLRALQSPLIREVRGRGLMIGIELTRRVQPYLEMLCERGILALPAGPNVLRLLPPLVIEREQLDRVLDVVAELLQGDARVGAGLAPAQDTCLQPSRAGASPAPTENREIALLYNMLTIPSYSGQEGALAHYLVEQAQQMGLHAYVDEAGNFVASTTEHQTDKQFLADDLSEASCESGVGHLDSKMPLILLGHMDTVRGNIPVRFEDGKQFFAESLSEASHGSGVDLRHSRLYGRGAVDAKGPLAAFICAAARIARSGVMQRPVIVIGAVEEEAATSRGARAVVTRYQPVGCVIGEPSGSQAVTIGYKGRLLIECHVTRPLAHSAGPLPSSCEVATTFWERVRTHADEWNRRHASGADSRGFMALTPSLRNINSVQDGLEEQTRLLIGYRLPPNCDIVEIRTQLSDWADELDLRLVFSGEEAAFQTSRTTPLARAFIGAIRASGGQASFKYKTGTSDMNVVGPAWFQQFQYPQTDRALASTPTAPEGEYTHETLRSQVEMRRGPNIVAYGPGDSRLDHTPQEHIQLSEYLQAIDVLEHVLTGVAVRREMGHEIASYS